MGMIIMNGKEYASSPKDGFPPIIYSDEEREIGVWRDGKPLYQKTVNIDFVNGRRDYQHGIQNVDMIFFDDSATFIYAKDKSEFNHFYNAGYNDSAQFVEGYGRFIQQVTRTIIILKANPNLGSNYSAIVTVRYTKTTDTPGSGKYTTYGGLAHHYSTTEQVVGTWIDGKPLYEKTYHFVETSEQTSKSYSIADLNIEVVLLEKSRIKFGANGGYGWQVVPSWYENNQYNMCVGLDTANINITVNGWKFLESVVTIQYTKTTD